MMVCCLVRNNPNFIEVDATLGMLLSKGVIPPDLCKYEVDWSKALPSSTSTHNRFVLVKPEVLGLRHIVTIGLSKHKAGEYRIFVALNVTKVLSGQDAIPVSVGGRWPVQEVSTLIKNVLLGVAHLTKVQYSVDERKRIDGGNIHLARLQFALYTGDLGDKRDMFLAFIRTLYGSVDATEEGVRNGGALLGVSATLHDNHSGNVSVTVKNGMHRYFTVTYYCKDDTIDATDVSPSTMEGLSRRVRMDIRLYGKFLDNNGIPTVASYLNKLRGLVDGNNDDSALGFWLRDQIMERLQLSAALKVRRIPFYRLLDDLADDVTQGDYVDDTITKGLLDLWLSDKLHLKTMKELSVSLSTSEKTIRRRMDILNERFQGAGISLRVPLGFLEHAIYSGASSSLSKEERREINRLRDDGNSNKITAWAEMHRRFAHKRKSISDVIFEDTGALKLTRVPVKKVQAARSTEAGRAAPRTENLQVRIRWRCTVYLACRTRSPCNHVMRGQERIL